MRQMMMFVFFCFLGTTTLIPAEEIHVTVMTGVLSQYVSVHGVRLHEDPVSQTDVFITFPRGFYADIWGSSGFDTRANFGKEIDYGVGRAGKYTDVSVTFFDLDKVFSAKGGDVIYPVIKLLSPSPFAMGKSHSVSPYVQGAYVWATKDSRENSGLLLTAGARHSWTLTGRFSIGQHIYIMHDTGIFGGDRGCVGRYQAGVNIKAGRITLAPSITFSVPLSVNDARKTYITTGISASKTW